MKDILIGFIIALVLGSIWNSMQQSPESGSQSKDGSAVNDLSVQAIVSVNQSNFQNEVLNQTQPVLVDFYTQSCPHCKKMAPMLGQIAQEYTGSLKVVKMDIMENQEIAHQYNIGGVPAFILFENGKPVESFVGEMSRPRLLSILKPHLLNTKPQPSENPPAT